MNTSPSSIKRPTDHYAWVWLVIGAALLPFSSIQPSFPLAAWLAPVFLLRFVRTQRPRVGLSLVAVVQAVAFGSNWYIGSAPVTLFAISGVLVGLLYTLGYAADRLVAPRLHGIARTLVFPLALTTVDFVGSRLGSALTPFLLPSLFSVSGAWDSPGYTQAPYLPLLQVVSLTGMWGLTFLMAWFASAINALWEHRFHWQPVRTGTLAFCTTLVAVLIFGSVRLAFFPPAQPTVRVATIAYRQDLFPTITDINPQSLMPGTPTDRADARTRFAPIIAVTSLALIRRRTAHLAPVPQPA